MFLDFKMTHQTVFRASLFLPLFLIFYPFVGIQYVVLAAVMYWGIDRWSLRTIKIQIALMPVYYAILLWVSFFAYGLIVADTSATVVATISAVAALVYGYIYAALVFAAYGLGRMFGVIRLN